MQVVSRLPGKLTSVLHEMMEEAHSTLKPEWRLHIAQAGGIELQAGFMHAGLPRNLPTLHSILQSLAASSPLVAWLTEIGTNGMKAHAHIHRNRDISHQSLEWTILATSPAMQVELCWKPSPNPSFMLQNTMLKGEGLTANLQYWITGHISISGKAK